MMQRLDGGVFGLEQLGIDPFDAYLGAVGDAAVNKRLAKRFIGILKRRVFADDGNRHFAVGVGDTVANLCPCAEIRSFIGKPEMAHDLGIQPLRVIGQRNLVDVVYIHAEDHRRRADVAEQANLAALLLGERMFGAAQQNVRLDANRQTAVPSPNAASALSSARRPRRCKGSA